MSTRSRTRKRVREEEQDYDDSYVYDLKDDELDLDLLSEEELGSLLFEEEEKEKGIWNLPTLAGLSLIGVGIAYIFQQLGMAPFDLSAFVAMLPWLAGVLIILLGFGVLSWGPKRRKKKKGKKVSETVKATISTEEEEIIVEETVRRRAKGSTGAKGKRRLSKSNNKKIAGVSAGIAEYFGIDPTLVRIAFVIGTIASGGPFLFAYLLLSFIMPNPPKKKITIEERINIIRDS